MHSLDSLKHNLRSCKGFSIAEMLVASFIGLMFTGVLLGMTTVNRNVMGKDNARTGLNQNLRGALDLVGADIRVAGENLGSIFPAVELTNGASGAPDQLTLRRNLLDEVLPLCTAITGGSGTTSIYFAIPGTVSGCVYSGHTHNYNSWRTYRLAQPSTSTLAYIYDSSAKLGEFFTYTNEVDTGTSYYLVRTAGTWSRSYPTASTTIYILEQWRFSMSSGILQLVINNDTTNTLDVSFGLTDFQARIKKQDDTFVNSFTTADNWTQIKAVEVTLSGSDTFGGNTLSKTMVGEFFPRNILSH
jgi:hypothetical protein